MIEIVTIIKLNFNNSVIIKISMVACLLSICISCRININIRINIISITITNINISIFRISCGISIRIYMMFFYSELFEISIS